MKPTNQAKHSVMNLKLPALVLILLVLAQTGCAPGAYTTIVYEKNGAYIAKDGFGNRLFAVLPVADPAPLLQKALDRGGDLYVAGGSYDFNLGFAGLNVSSFSKISIARDATFTVPRGFSLALFTFQSVQATTLEGGFYTEEGGPGNSEDGVAPARRDWTLFRFVGAAGPAGCHGNVIRDIRTWFVGTVIDLTATSTRGWNNGNRFSNFSVYAYRVGIDFSSTGLFQRNLFDNLIYQTRPEQKSLAGARNIRGLANTFFDVYFYDALRRVEEVQEDGTVTVTVEELIKGNIAHITEEATATLIIGGIMTQHEGKFVDDGLNTQIIDELHIRALHTPP